MRVSHSEILYAQDDQMAYFVLKGTLTCLDGYMNVAMENTHEVVGGQVKNSYGDAFIRGNNGTTEQQTFKQVLGYNSSLYPSLRQCYTFPRRRTFSGIAWGPHKRSHCKNLIILVDVCQFTIESRERNEAMSHAFVSSGV